MQSTGTTRITELNQRINDLQGLTAPNIMFIFPFIQMEKGDWCLQELFNMQQKHPTH